MVPGRILDAFVMLLAAVLGASGMLIISNVTSFQYVALCGLGRISASFYAGCCNGKLLPPHSGDHVVLVCNATRNAQFGSSKIEAATIARQLAIDSQ